MTTDADRAIEAAKEHLQKAMIELSKAYSGYASGLSEYRQDVQDEIPMIMSKIAAPLNSLRNIRPD